MATSNDVIGFVGIGAMGTPMAGNLARAGYKVVVFDLDAARAGKLARETGVTVATSLADLGAASDIIITMLPDGKAVRVALCGDNDSFKNCVLIAIMVIESCARYFRCISDIDHGDI